MNRKPTIAILWYGDRDARNKTNTLDNKFSKVIHELRHHSITTVPVVYHDDFVDEVREQLREVDGVLVWVNPIEEGRSRNLLDNLLRDIAANNVFVSTHPDIILKMGTKEVLFQTREMEWGSGDIALYRSLKELEQQLPKHLANGQPRVLKQNRGNNGIGVWKVELDSRIADQGTHSIVRVQHAERNSTEEKMPLHEFISRCGDYFKEMGQMIDQPYFSPVPNGMIRCYMTRNEVVGFGHQYVTALLRTEQGTDPLQPQPRIYYPETKPEFQTLKAKLENRWIAEMQQILGIHTDELPIIWDADFLYGPQTEAGEETYKLCEINVSSVYPFPDSALPKLVKAAVVSATKAAGERSSVT